jgi:hypothetical protein
MNKAFYSAADNLGTHSYFRSLGDAQSFQAAFGGYILMTTTNRIWRVTQN